MSKEIYMPFSPIAVAAGLSLLVVSASASTPTEPTPAQERIALAETRVARNPGSSEAWSELALSFARRARETADVSFYARADEALRRAFDISPANLEAKKVKAWVLLGQHEFEAALKLAEELNTAVPDDVQVYGYLADANAELGRYGKAEEAAQWMLNLRPGNVPGLTRAAYLRELFGDGEGAIELMALAYELVSPAETEDRAWILTQIAHLNVLMGRREAAGALLEQALELFPDYHYALAQLARVRSGEGRRAEAVALLEKRYALAAHPENLYDLAVALESAGRSEAARAAFTEFEQKARAEMSSNDNANRELAFYLADQGGRPEEALRVAEREAARRRDVTTLEALAWSLYRSGRPEDAGREMDAALAVGFRDARLLYRAALIAAARGDDTAATRHLQASLRLDPDSEVADDVRRALAARAQEPAPRVTETSD
jgi:tetratricopeptide (TPR) repeat protein